MNAEYATDVAKGVPPATVATLSVFGVTIPEAIQFLTLIYCVGLCIQMLYKAWRWVVAWRSRAASR